MVVATCFQRLYRVIYCADFVCETVIPREATKTEGLVLNKSALIFKYSIAS